MDELVTQLYILETPSKTEDELLFELYENLQYLKYEFNKFVPEIKQCSSVCKEIAKTIEELSGSVNKNLK